MKRALAVLCDRDVFVEVYVLDSLDHFHAVLEGALEGFPAEDEAHAACAFVDDGGEDGVVHVGFAFAFAAAVDQPYATVVAVDELVAGEVDGVVVGVGQLGIDEG